MEYSKLEIAKAEAKRFLEAAGKVKVKMIEASQVAPRQFCIEDYTKENGSCLRASLDLTRALAELRKP